MISTQSLQQSDLDQTPSHLARSASETTTANEMAISATRAKRLRRVLDLGLGSLLLAATSPIALAVAVAVRCDSAGPVIYQQTRVGHLGRPFRIMKFRTMVDQAETGGACLAQHQDPRVTRIGRLLRASRLDELPQLVNIVRGEMSLVGPRPERPEFVSEFATQVPGYTARHLVRPGLTGPAQIRLGYDAAPSEKLVHDLAFVGDPSVLRYLVTAASTPLAVIAWMRCAGSSCAAPTTPSPDADEHDS